MGGRHGRVRGLRALVATAAVAAGLAVVSAGPAGAAPANDAFAAAQEITGLAGQLTAENAGAGPNESGEPDHGKRGAFTLGAHSSVWYRWTAPTTELMTFDVTCGAAPCFLIPIVDVYTGSAVDALTVVPDATASYNSFTSQFDAVAGTTYRIAVAGRSFGGTGTFLLRWSNRPANDDFAAPQVIAGASGTLSASNVGATTEPGEPVPAVGQLSASVWFSWTPSTSATSNFAVGGSDAGVVLAVYQGDALGALTLVTDAPRIDGSTPMPRVSFAGTVGTTYRILVRGITPGGRGTINLAWSLGAPANDIGSSWTSFNDPIHAQIVREMVVFPGHSVVGSNVGATKETGERNHGGVPGGHSIWYSFQAHFDGASMTFDTVGSSFDTVLAIYEDGVLVAEDDDSAGGGASRASFTTRTRNTTGPTETLVEYLIAVDGKAGSTGPVRLNWYLTVPPNDDFADAEPITGVSGLVTTGQNLGASLEPGEPDHGFTTFPHTGRFTSHSVWYEWTAPANGAFAFSAAGSAGLGATFVPVIDVYTGTSLAALTSVATASTPSAFATVAFTAVEGSTYLIAVAGSDPFATGLVSLQWSDAFPFPQRLTSTAVVCASAATVGIAYGCTATVTDVDSSPSSDGWKGDPAGAATITLVGVNPPTWGCTLIPDGDPSTDSSTCTITQFPDAVPDPATGTAAAAYLETGSLLHSASSDPDGFGPITISARESSTQVVCAPSSVAATAPTTCTATVLEGAFDGGPLAGLQTHPAGTVTFSTSAPGAFASSTCLLVPQTIFSRPQSACSVTYTPAAAGTQRINASYATDRVHASSADPDGFTLQVDPKPQRATATHILCTPQRFTFGGTSTCTATVDDLQVGGTAAPPAGTVDLTSEVGGTFATCTLVAVDADSSSCDGTYAPTVYGFGSHHLGSSYPGSTDHASSSDANSSFVVLLRTSSTSVACEPLVIGVASTCTVSVTDTTGPADSGFAPFDVVNVSAEGPGTLSAPSCFLSNVASGSPLSQCTVDYTPSGVGDGTHTITADYPGPLNSIYLPSSGSVDLPLATDTEAPVTTAQVIAGTAGTPPWYRSPSVTVRLSATDTGGSGTASIAYTVDGGAPVVVASDTADVVVTGDALHALQFAATDGVGNTEASSSFAVGIDTVAPTLTVTGVVNGASYPVGSVPVAGCTAADNLAAAGSLAGPPTLTVTPLPAGALGGHTATCSITDKAGNPGSAAATYTVVAARVDEVSVRFTGAYSFAASGPAATGNIVEGTGTLAGAVTLGAGRSVAVDCTSVSASLNRASCSVTVGAPALGSAPVVTSGLAAYQRTALGGGRVRHDITMLGLRPVRIGPFTVPVPYLLQVTVVDAG